MQEVSLWLVPRREDDIYLQEIIDQLAAQYKAPRFSPHVTVAGRLKIYRQTSLSALALATPVLRLQNQGLDHSPELFRTVYVRTSLTQPLISLRPLGMTRILQRSLNQ